MARILIADDSPIMRKNLSAILKKVGHTVVAEAANGEEAVIEYSKHKPDLVTMDITMPIMNGVDAVKKIIDEFEDAKIIIISAQDNKFMVFSALQSGAKHYIIKPFTPEKVMEVINDILDVPPENSEDIIIAAPSSNYDEAISSIKNSISSLNKTIDRIENETDK